MVISGIGKAHAAAAACYGCLTFVPKTVVNAGAAGALDSSHPAGGIYQISKIIEHDRPDIFNRQTGLS
jgi:Nucleoside phosphorylase